MQVESHNWSSEADFGVTGKAGGVVVELPTVPTHEAVCNTLHFEHLPNAVHRGSGRSFRVHFKLMADCKGRPLLWCSGVYEFQAGKEGTWVVVSLYAFDGLRNEER